MKIVMCGSHYAGEPVIRGLLEEGIRFDYFVCLTPDQGERYNISGYYDYRMLAEQHDIPVYHPQSYSLNDEKDKEFFVENSFDVLIQGGWQRLFPEDILSTLRIGAIGGHGSSDFLPKGRGRSPLNWSLIEGKTRFINQLFIIKPGVDNGDVFDYQDFDITESDDIETLYMKISITTRDMLRRSLPLLLQETARLEPQLGVPSYYKKRNPEDGEIDWENMDVQSIYNLVRALTKPYPGAFGDIEGRRFRIWRCRVFDTRLMYRNARYGSIVESFGDKIIIKCRGGLLLLDQYDVE